MPPPPSRPERTYVPLAEYPGERVVVRCDPCGREGSYSRERLLRRYGPDTGLPTLLAWISADCPRRKDWRLEGELCRELGDGVKAAYRGG
jgi:hypothetical protein